MNKTCKNHKLLLVTELIFCNNPKDNWNILSGFCWRNQSDTDFQVGRQKMSSLRHCMHKIKLFLQILHKLTNCTLFRNNTKKCVPNIYSTLTLTYTYTYTVILVQHCSCTWITTINVVTCENTNVKKMTFSLSNHVLLTFSKITHALCCCESGIKQKMILCAWRVHFKHFIYAFEKCTYGV